MPSQATATILFVDDDEASRQAYTWILQEAGFRVREAGTGIEAIRLAAEKPDLVILDVNLPDIDGFEVCRRIKAHPATAAIPVLHLSAVYVSSAEKAHGLEGGADSYLTKPVDPQEVIATARALLRIRQAEEAAAEAARHWQTTFDSIRDAVCFLGPAGIILRCNEAMKRLLGGPGGDVLGRSYPELLHTALGPAEDPFPPPPPDLHLPLTRELALGGRWFLLTVDPVRDAQATITGSVHLIADITERKQLEEQLRQAQKMEAVGRLAGGIAHDFNNLLTAITGNVALLRVELGQDAPVQELIRAIDQAAWRAAELTRQLLGFSRRSMLWLRPTNPQHAVEEVVAILHRTIDPRIRLEVRTVPDLWAVQADPAHLTQILMNLCLNAVDALPAGGRLLLATDNVMLDDDYSRRHLEARPGAYVRLQVSDTGHGIAPEVLPRIFDPFFTTKPPGKGTGLGLAMVFGIVKQHQGWVECSSVVGQGTTFDIYLPRFGAEQEVVPTPTDPRPEGGSETILLADDEVMLRELGRTILQRYGYHVLLAEDGRQAVEIYRQYMPGIDLVLLDLTMPNLSGRDALHELLQIDPQVHVLFASGYFADPGAEVDQPGVLGFLQKPYRERDLARLVRETLDKIKAYRTGPELAGNAAASFS